MGACRKTTLSHINSILEVYAALSSTQLERLTHHEDPWIEARTGRRPSEPMRARNQRAIDDLRITGNA